KHLRAFALLMLFHLILKGNPPKNPWCSHGCPLHRSTSATRMAIYSSCCQCCQMLPNPNWVLSVGVAGTKATRAIRVGQLSDDGSPFGGILARTSPRFIHS